MPSIGRRLREDSSLLNAIAWIGGMFAQGLALPRAIKAENASLQKLLSAQTADIMSKYKRGGFDADLAMTMSEFETYNKKFKKRGADYGGSGYYNEKLQWADASEFAADPVTEEDMAATMAKSTNVATLLSLAQRVQSGEVEILNIESFANAAWDPEARVVEITIKPNPGFNRTTDEVMFGKPKEPPKPAAPFGTRDLDID